jgi:Xaa-Pro dipeptidase
MYANPFSVPELDGRLGAFREKLADTGLHGAVLTTPENIFYLTGLDHWGYFAPHMLFVPVSRTPVLVTRAMEKVSIADMVSTAEFRGHGDSQTAAETMADVLTDAGAGSKRLGLECDSAGLSMALGEELKRRCPADWRDISGVVDTMRLVKSAEEQALMRRAAKVTDAATLAAIAAAGEGASEREVAAACAFAMIEAGGDPPGFGPFIRAGSRLGQEHTTWGNERLASGGALFLELSGCAQRYHAPNGRLVHIKTIPDENREMAGLAGEAFTAVVASLRPGAVARDVYAAWQQVVNEAGLDHYRRHHCGYAVGIGVAPSWTGGKSVTGLRRDSPLEIRAGMTFHILSWLMGTGRGDFFLSDTVLVGEHGPERLTTAPAVNVV